MLISIRALLCSSLTLLAACGGRETAEGGGAGTHNSVPDGGADATDTSNNDAGLDAAFEASPAPPCDPKQNLLTTGNDAWDAYDCMLIELSLAHGHPDPRVVKSQMMQESSFQVFAISPDSPCGTHEEWTDAESKSYGLLQVTLACGEAAIAMLPNGHPNLTQDQSSELWATSIYNPRINLEQGILRIVAGMNRLKTRYPDCSVTDYTLMAAGAYNSGNRAVQGCLQFNERAETYVNSVLSRYISFASGANWENPYPNPPI
jgi:hypothetical protein